MVAVLNDGARHIIKLIARDSKDGWASVSEQLCSIVPMMAPEELVEFEKLESGGRARLTVEGQHVYDAMRWLEE